jgi:hypothetical protein
MGDGVKPAVPSVDNRPKESGLAEESVGKAVARQRLHRFLVEFNESGTHASPVKIVEADKPLQTVIGLEDSPA